MISKEIGDRAGEAADYLNLSALFDSAGEPVDAEGYLEKALSISQDTGHLEKEFVYLCAPRKKIEEAFDCLSSSMEKSENLRTFLRENDLFKVPLSDLDIRRFPYRNLAAFFVFMGNPKKKALYVAELACTKALTDLMATRYSVERQISVDPQSWIGTENIIKQESNCSCLYI